MSVIHGANYGTPTLDLNFAKNKSLIDTVSGRNLVTFSRAQANYLTTYVGADGLIKYASADEPRFDHNPLTGECLGLLIEEQRANLITYSEQFDNAYWNKDGASIIANSTMSPDGTSTADLIVENASGTAVAHRVYTSSTVMVPGTRYTYSVFAKAGSRNWVSISPGGTWGYGSFNLSSGTVGTWTDGGSSAIPFITPVGNGWYRCGFTATAASVFGQNPSFMVFMAAADNTAFYNGDGTSGLYLWGAQVEAGSFPTSYIPTSGSTVTRSADSASITGTNFSRWYNPARVGTLFIDRRCNSPGASNAVIAALGGPSVFNNHIGLIASGTQEYLSHTGWSVNMWGPLSTPAIGDRKKYAIGFSLETNGTNAALDGVLQGTRTPSNNVISDLILGGYSNTFNRLTYYPTRLQDFQLQQLTK